MITSADLKARANQQPFTPFRVVISSGDKYPVTHPDLIWVGTRDVQVGTASSKDPATYENCVRIAILHVTALEDMQASAKSKKNGKAG